MFSLDSQSTNVAIGVGRLTHFRNFHITVVYLNVPTYICLVKIEDAIQQKKFKSEFEKLVVNIIYTSRWLEYEEGKLFRKYDITLPQYNLLRILRGQYPKAASVNLLIDRMLDKSSNASRIVETLRKKGLVDRKECKSDRRKVDVIINNEGLRVLEEANTEMTALHENHKKALTTTEAEQLNELLDKLRTTE